ncbi:MAG: DUF302 domain-containing protein [Methylocella sp.]
MLDDGLFTIPSDFSVDDTISRFEAALQAKGVTLFAKIDHGAGAVEAGMTLRPTFLLIFGNARTGAPLMQLNQRIGIDLPLKVLIWQDADEKVWLTYNDPAWLATRHRLGDAAAETVAALENSLAVLARDAGAG